MTLGLYQASVAVFETRLKALSKFLATAEANAKERGIDETVFLTARLAPDMFALTRQVQIATDHAKGASARLSGREVPSYEDNEASFADLQARISKTLAFIETVAAEDVDGSEDRVVSMKTRAGELSFTGAKYLLDFAMPNFYFHISSAYGILRANGVPLGKKDFMGV